MCTVTLNNELKGIELSFDSKPSEDVLFALKSNGYRWHMYKKIWYAKQSEKTLSIADQLKENDNKKPLTAIATQAEPKAKKAEQKILSLFERTQYTENENANLDKKLYGKDIAKLVREHIKNQFPECKFSITCSNFNSVSIEIKESPYTNTKINNTEGERLAPHEYNRKLKELNPELTAIEDYCTKYLDSYKYCTCYDPYGDYGSSNNIYTHVSIDYDYKQVEQTENIIKDIADFKIKSIEQEKAEQAAQEIRYQEQEKEREEEHKQHLIREAESKKEIELINNNVSVSELIESDQYFIINAEFAHLNKNQTLEQYQEEVTKNDFYLNNVKIKRELHFSSTEALEHFKHHLLTDFDFLEGTGGSYTDDERFNSMIDYRNMEKEEKETVIFNLIGIAVYFNNQLQFVIDTQGYSYSRYIGLTDNAKVEKELTVEPTITAEVLTELKEKADTLTDYSMEVITALNIVDTWQNESWNEYKDALKNKLKTNNFRLTKAIIQQLPEELEQLKNAMYKLLIEVDGIQDQFANAELKDGQKLTLYYISEFGSIIESRITFNSYQPTKYAQYNNAVKLTFTPQKKRSQYYKYFYSDMIIFNGWLELPETVLHNVEQRNGMIITSTKFLSCDKNQYDEILNYFEQQEQKPIINTYKPTF